MLYFLLCVEEFFFNVMLMLLQSLRQQLAEKERVTSDALNAKNEISDQLSHVQQQLSHLRGLSAFDSLDWH